jgi:hypothetical protein
MHVKRVMAMVGFGDLLVVFQMEPNLSDSDDNVDDVGDASNDASDDASDDTDGEEGVGGGVGGGAAAVGGNDAIGRPEQGEIDAAIATIVRAAKFGKG